MASKRIEINRQRRHKGFALAGAHFSNLAQMQYHPADQLHVKVPHVQCTLRYLAHHSKGSGQDIVNRLTGGELFLQFRRMRRELLIRHRLHRRFKAVDFLDSLGELLDKSFVPTTKNLGQRLRDHLRLYFLIVYTSLATDECNNQRLASEPNSIEQTDILSEIK